MGRKTDPTPGVADRLKRIEARLEMSPADVVRKTGIPRGTYVGWRNGSATDAGTLKAFVNGLGAWDRHAMMWWLPDGKGREPRWLTDENLDPWTPPVNHSEEPSDDEAREVAFPRAAIEALEALDQLRLADGLREPLVIDAWTALKNARAKIPALGIEPRLQESKSRVLPLDDAGASGQSIAEKTNQEFRNRGPQIRILNGGRRQAVRAVRQFVLLRRA